jgi:hypothetical protein
MNDMGRMVRRLEVVARMQAHLATALEHCDDPSRLLELSEFVGAYMWNCHGGAFALASAEQALRDRFRVSASRVPGWGALVEGRTLHVLTEASAVGGHTRLAHRWIELMDDEGHAVVLTRQRSCFDPTWVRPEGRDVPVLDLFQGGRVSRLDRTSRLVGLFRDAGRIVLHIDPDDAVSVAAAHQAAGADIRFVNHADHVAWLGASLPMTLLNLRQAGKRLAANHRGIPEAMSDVVPLPIPTPQRIDRGEARRRLGIGQDEVVLLTIATGYKFLPVEGRSLEPALDAVLRRSGVRLIAIGPDMNHPVFSMLASQHPGRVHAVGVIPQPDVYRAAADIYLDSYPFCSPTSMLESANLGTPVLSLQPDFEELGILYSECPGLGRDAYAAETADGYVDLLDRLVLDPGHRRAVSESIQIGMDIHRPESWRNALRHHLARTPSPLLWAAAGLEPRMGHLNAVLAGLGKDPFRRPKLKRWLILGPQGPARILMARMGF